MGLCASTSKDDAARPEEKQKSKDIEHALAVDNKSDQSVNKLLLLGAGQSGKSTLFKQMITIYGKGFPESERQNFTPIVYNNIIVAMKTLCQQSKEFGPVAPANLASKKFIEDLKEDDEITEEVGHHVKVLWHDDGILATYEKRARFQLTDSAKYYFCKIDEIAKDGYIPTEQDVLRSRVPTTGIVENAFDIDGNSFKMYDVGGQRSERKKWIHCFENVTAVLFVAAISEYDQVLYEDETTNRIVEALELFEEITNSEWFVNTSMILFLNKRDLFMEKLEQVPLTTFFPEYTGKTYEEGVEFMQESFENRNHQQKDIYTHVTCATDTNNVFVVFNSVKDIIIKKGLSKAGLM